MVQVMPKGLLKPRAKLFDSSRIKLKSARGQYNSVSFYPNATTYAQNRTLNQTKCEIPER